MEFANDPAIAAVAVVVDASNVSGLAEAVEFFREAWISPWLQVNVLLE